MNGYTSDNKQRNQQRRRETRTSRLGDMTRENVKKTRGKYLQGIYLGKYQF